MLQSTGSDLTERLNNTSLWTDPACGCPACELPTGHQRALGSSLPAFLPAPAPPSDSRQHPDPKGLVPETDPHQALHLAFSGSTPDTLV